MDPATSSFVAADHIIERPTNAAIEKDELVADGGAVLLKAVGALQKDFVFDVGLKVDAAPFYKIGDGTAQPVAKAVVIFETIFKTVAAVKVPLAYGFGKFCVDGGAVFKSAVIGHDHSVEVA